MERYPNGEYPYLAYFIPKLGMSFTKVLHPYGLCVSKIEKPFPDLFAIQIGSQAFLIGLV